MSKPLTLADLKVITHLLKTGETLKLELGRISLVRWGCVIATGQAVEAILKKRRKKRDEPLDEALPRM